ncbi:MAG: glycogen/starch/alpha-glucan family phosphorylase, partial [Clostridia bacterium]|nr:glycogen/starch/alpha-glucan family phosphorylase [Clostridia bacterium]
MKISMDSEIRRLLNLDESVSLSSLASDELLRGVFLYVKELMCRYTSQKTSCGKRIYYASMETLPGRTLSNNLMNLPEADEILRWMNAHCLSINALEEMENEPRLGNGGLGRLAACMIESATAHKILLDLSTIRFRCGLFRQGFAGGKQTEFPDNWLDENGTYPFEIRRDDASVDIRYRYHGKLVTVKAVPYDIPVMGAHTVSDTGNCLRRWAVDSINSEHYDILSLFRRIDETLYPNDSDYTGRQLRLIQEYFLSAATVGDMIRQMKESGYPLETIPEHFVLHINDTHPVLMIPELMRILRHDYKMPYKKAYDICSRTCVFTNHTIMSEALEKWPIPMVESLLPEIYAEILQIHRHFETDICDSFLHDEAIKKMSVMDILWNGEIRMAHLALCVSSSVNGVAKIHTDILCRRELAEFYKFFPEKFRNVTNGVTQRKFLGHANPELASRIDAWCGTEEWRTDFSKISVVRAFADDPEAQNAYAEAHLVRKEALRQFVLKQRGIDIPTHFLYDVHVKRIHEYKRQSLGCLKILSLFLTLKKNPAMDFAPTAFIFVGKAAASYHLAKVTLEFIRALEVLINNDPTLNDKMRVVFIEDFDVTKAELIYAAADCSEQISTASKEASGTGNMKFMMNGAVTLGTLDGANVEIHDAVGDENMYL